MLPDRVSNPGPLTYESGALPIALRGQALNIINFPFVPNGKFIIFRCPKIWVYYSLIIMCLNIGSPNNHHFPFGTNGKVLVLGVPILKHFRVPMTSGVPQGSVLGPLLVDLQENNQSEVRLFADDTAVYLTVAHPNDSSTLQNDLDTLQQWE